MTANNALKNKSSKIFVRALSILQNHLIYYPTPSNLFYAWGIGSLLGILLVVQVLTGVLLAMHYVPHIEEAFTSVERIMREVPAGWLLRYMHANGSSFIFILMYMHVARGIYFQSYRKPKQFVWCSGAVLFILMAGISFLGYTLPWGQMSFWGATVITNLLSAIPVVGAKLVVWVWGGFAINQNTLNRFFSLHYILSIVALGISGLHLMLLHAVGSTNPVANEPELDYTKFFPYYVTKDVVTLIGFFFVFFVVVFYKPNMFGHPDNYIRADALVTPAHIVPEWYFLPFYAMLKAFPSKAAGALAMILSMAILLLLPWLDSIFMGLGGLISDPKYKPGFTIIYLIYVANMIVLGWLGGLAVSDVNQFWMQFCTGLYFSYYLFAIPFFTLKEWLFVTFISKQLLLKHKSGKSADFTPKISPLQLVYRSKQSLLPINHTGHFTLQTREMATSIRGAGRILISRSALKLHTGPLLKTNPVKPHIVHLKIPHKPTSQLLLKEIYSLKTTVNAGFVNTGQFGTESLVMLLGSSLVGIGFTQFGGHSKADREESAESVKKKADDVETASSAGKGFDS
jgi:ubiquinol-cytochrome c reductase cytochrome b subunit